jgi:hypothetical protein
MSSPEETRPVGSDERPTPTSKRRGWKPRLLELLLWTAVAVATAAFLVYASERWLPANF